MKIPWKYCECGCHGHEATVGGLYLTTYNSLNGGKHYLAVGQHHANLNGKPYDSAEEINTVIQELLVKQKRDLKKQLKELEGL